MSEHDNDNDDPFAAGEQKEPSAVFSAGTPRSAALQAIPAEWRERLVADAAAMGIRADDDVGWLLVGSVINAWASAAAAGQAAESVQSSVSGIPKAIFDNAVNAGRDIGAVVVAAINKHRDDVIGKILSSSQTGADLIAGSADKLTASLDAAIEKKKKEGLQDWADAAAKSGLHAARAATFRSIFFSLFLSLILLCAAGAGGAYIEHIALRPRLSPTPLVAGATGANCGFAEVQGQGRQYICEALPPPAPPPAP
ncbi:hypothetical protein HF668_15520 [Acidithiobacillus ferridurans]|uniref:hypothetical protein n=1 Tax=Acidithiobacillus ferridurans TaxID=1232575 RepID=UPI001C07D03E|nr:hypothetical protein [Acidithiobacillus ferridurans]MBU2806519.1 hypothetical protein [Acidithiobacillus ferridurans]